MAYVNQNGQVRVGVRGWVPVFGPEDPGTPNTIDQDSINFILASGISDSVQTSAIETLVSDLKAYGLWTKMKAIYPFVGGTASSHKFNLKDPRDLDAAYRLVFNGGWVHSSTGAKPNGTNGYSDTFVSNNLMNQNNISISTYLGADNLGDPNTTCAIGSWNGSHGSSIYPGGNTTNTLFIINGSFNNIRVNTDNKSRGLYLASKTTSTSFVHVRGNKTNVTFTTSSNITSSFKLSKIGDYNGDYSGQQHRFTSIGDGLTDTEAANFYTSVQKFQTTLGRHLGTPYVSDPDAIAFLMAAGITDGTQAAAINTLVIRMKADGVWTKMRAIYPFVGGSAASHKWNLKDPRDLDAAYRLVFTGGWTHTGTGAKPNGSSYADTKLAPSAIGQDNIHISFYSRTDVNNSGYDIGSGRIGNAVIISPRETNNLSFYINHWAADNVSNTDSLGYYVGSRLSSSSASLFKNGVKIINSTKTSISPTPTANFYLGAYNLNGTIINYSTREQAFTSIGDGLTDTDATNLYSAVQAYQTTLGRQVNVPLVSDTDAQTFLNAANITSFQQASAVNKLVVDLKAAGVWSKMKAIYPFVGGSAASHKWNLKDPRDLDAAYRLVFNGGWTHTSTGAKPNGSNGYADTFVVPKNVFNATTFEHVSYYSRTNSTLTTPPYRYDLGVDNYDASNNYYGGLSMIIKRDTNATLYSSDYGTSATYRQANTTTSDSLGFFIGSQTGTNIKLYKNNSILATNTNASLSAYNMLSPLATRSIWIGTMNELNYTTQNRWSDKESAFISIGEGLNDTEATSLYTAVQTYQTSLGRQLTTPIYNNGLVLNLDAGNANSYPGTGTTWFDLASGNNGTLFSGITYDVNNGGGLTLNGSNQYVSSFNNTNLNFTTSDKFTISCFFKATSTPSTFLGLIVNGNASGEWSYGIWVTNSKIQVGTHNDGRYGNSTIVAGQIYQVTLTYSNNTMIIYLNGVNDGTFTSVSLFNGLNQQLVIGRKGANAGWYFPGTIYNVQIYNRSLSATEILNNFNSSRGRFGL
jgi:hypothetical protein